MASKTGTVDRSTKSTDGHWATANIGNIFEIGDAVRTSSDSNARLTLDDGSILGLEEGTLIRFLDKKPGSNEQALDLKLGAASIEAPEKGTSIRTLFGLARLEGGSRIQLKRSGDTLRYEVLLGSATLESISGEKVSVEAGQHVEVSFGSASLEVVEEETEQQQDPVDKAEEELVSEGPILATVKGKSVVLHGAGEDKYRPLAPGESTLAEGTTLKVGAGSSVQVSQGSSSAVLSAGGTYVIGGAQLVEAKSGTVTISADGIMKIAVAGGVIVTKKGSATISSVAEGTRVTANSGEVTLVGKTSETLVSGEEGTLSREGLVEVDGRGIPQTDLALHVGQSIVVHDPSPPTAIRFLFEKKCIRGVIRLKSKSGRLPGADFARGQGNIALPIGPGAASYSLYCLDETGKSGPVEATGVVTVLHDSGSRAMPKRAPSTSIEVNGRNYDVLYQNQLPRVTFRWSKAPPDVDSFRVHVNSRGRNRSLSTSSPSYTFSSSALGGGKHTVHFTGGGRISRRSTVNIRFDNATPTASLNTPVNTGAGPGGTVKVSGTALPGWSVSVDAQAVELDGTNHFSMNTQMPSDGRALAVHLSHPSRGDHVYLRKPEATQ